MTKCYICDHDGCIGMMIDHIKDGHCKSIVLCPACASHQRDLIEEEKESYEN